MTRDVTVLTNQRNVIEEVATYSSRRVPACDPHAGHMANTNQRFWSKSFLKLENLTLGQLILVVSGLKPP